MRDIDIWRNELFDVVCTIANRNELEALWLGRNPSQISSYEEEVAHVFNDYEIDAFLDLDPTVSGATRPQIEALRGFRDTFREFVTHVTHSYGQTPDPRAILADNGWAEVQRRAEIFVRSLTG
jgi:hypothetical protein